MNYLKKLGRASLYSILFILGLTLVVTLLNYIGLIGIKVVNITSYLIPFLSFFIGGWILGKKSTNKGWLEGIKFGFIFITLLFIFNFLAFDEGYTISNFLTYGIVLLASVLGSMIGINMKKQ